MWQLWMKSRAFVTLPNRKKISIPNIACFRSILHFCLCLCMQWTSTRKYVTQVNRDPLKRQNDAKQKGAFVLHCVHLRHFSVIKTPNMHYPIIHVPNDVKQQWKIKSFICSNNACLCRFCLLQQLYHCVKSIIFLS